MSSSRGSSDPETKSTPPAAPALQVASLPLSHWEASASGLSPTKDSICELLINTFPYKTNFSGDFLLQPRTSCLMQPLNMTIGPRTSHCPFFKKANVCFGLLGQNLKRNHHLIYGSNIHFSNHTLKWSVVALKAS